MRLLFSLILFLSAQAIYAQGVRIGGNPGTPDPSAILDVHDTTKGFLPPRLTTSQRNSIQNPSNGLLVYCTDTNLYFYFDGNSWCSIGEVPGTVTQTAVRVSTATSSLNTSTFSEAHPDYRIGFVPKYSNSIFLIEFSFSINTAMSSNTIFHMQLVRNIGGQELPVGVGPINGSRNRTSFVSRPSNGYDSNDMQTVYMIGLDTGLIAGNPYTYGFKYRRENNGSGTCFFNSSSGDNSVFGFSGIMTMKITEIKQ